MTREREPYLLEPRMWFGVLCEAVNTDERGRINFQRVFNQVTYFSPSEDEGVPPHGLLAGILVVGLEHGVGQFVGHLELCDADGQVIWEAPNPWEFRLEPEPTAVLAVQIRRYFRQAGHYYFQVRVEPGDRRHQVHFEVTASPGPQRGAASDQNRAQ